MHRLHSAIAARDSLGPSNPDALMPNTSTSSPDARYDLAALLAPPALAKLGAIGIVLLAIVVLFLWIRGWLSAGLLTQTRVVDTFQAVHGLFHAYRRNQAKRVCLEGSFESIDGGATLSTATVFKPGRTPVIGRYVLAGGLPTIPDG